MLTVFTIVLLGTALAASALGAIGSPGGGATLNVIVGNVAAERQVDGTPAALPPVVLFSPTSGSAPVTVPPTSGSAPVAAPVTVLLPPTSGAAPVAAPVRLPSTSTAPSSALLGLLVGGAGAASGLTLLVMAGRRRR
ncbi:MAG: hypothetical protein H0V71_09335 [Chloroflexi bacterium]|nr:hypothetical protein [Chloroflexota bacterium]